MKTIYVGDKLDVCCPSCLKQVPAQMVESAKFKGRMGAIVIFESHCPYCGEELELRFGKEKHV